MLKVEKVMTKYVISGRRETSIYEATEVMRKNNITSMPVVEGNMPSAGVIIPAPKITAGL